MKRNIFLITITTLMAFLVSSCGTKVKKEIKKGDVYQITGAGAKVPEPFYLMVFDAYKSSTGNIVSYEGTGSSAGLLRLRNKTVDFAGSDEFLTDEEMARMSPVVHIPTCMVAIVLCYNVPGVGELNLSGDVVADIFDGKINMWNDDRIQSLNPHSKLPAKTIVPIFRFDPCVVNYIFTSYLSASSKEWQTKYGVRKNIKFPVGRAGTSNPDVATRIEEYPYSIGYMGSEYALVLKLKMARLKNANGDFVAPTVESIAAAATEENVPADTRAFVVNSTAKGAYPMSYFSWLLVYKEQNYNNRSEAQARTTVNALRYILSDETHKSSADIGFAPLPQSMIDNSLENLKKITYNGKPILK